MLIHEIEALPEYRRRVEQQLGSLLAYSDSRYELAQYAAESYAYWSLRAITAEKDYADLVRELHHERARK